MKKYKNFDYYIGNPYDFRREYDSHIKSNAVTKFINWENIKQNKMFKEYQDVPFAIKANISVKNEFSDGASKSLEGYKSIRNAPIVTKLLNLGFKPVCLSNMNELGLGGDGKNQTYGDVINFIDPNRMQGGSSSGSAYLVSSNILPFALGTDTGDSIRKPAAYGNILGFKPSWGVISREYIYDYCPELDTVGYFTNNLDDMISISEKILINREFDDTQIDYKFNVAKDIDSFNNKDEVRLGIIKQSIPYILNYEKLIAYLNKRNIKVVEVDFDNLYLLSIFPTYETLSYSYSYSSNLFLNGINFGYEYKNNQYQGYGDYITKNRKKSFEFNSLRRFIIGVFNLETNYYETKLNSNKINWSSNYHAAESIKKRISSYYLSLFDKYRIDSFLKIPLPQIPPMINSKGVKKNMDLALENILLLDNFSMSPSITIPLDFKIDNENNYLFSINISNLPGEDFKLLSLAKRITENYD